MKFTKSKAGHYFWNVSRVWQETFDVQTLPFWVGSFRGRIEHLLPKDPGPEIIKRLMDGDFLGRVQSNRVGCFDQTFTLSKSVSILCFGITPPAAWHKWSKTIEEKSRPIVEGILDRMTIRFLAGGRLKVPAAGCAIGFIHYKNYFGDPHGHVHYAIPNMAVSQDGTVGSIGNMRSFMQDTPLHRAMFQKGIDDALQASGFKTKRVGTYVDVEGIPQKLIDSLSTGKKIIQRMKADKGFDSAQAIDFYAREARRKGDAFDPNPEQMHTRVMYLASQLGVTLDSLRHDNNSPPPKTGTATSRSEAYDVAQEALRKTIKAYGEFSRENYLERLYTLGIGRSTTSEDLKYMGESLLKKIGQEQARTRETQNYHQDRAAKAKKKYDQEQNRTNDPPNDKQSKATYENTHDTRRKTHKTQSQHRDNTADEKDRNKRNTQSERFKTDSKRYSTQFSQKAKEQTLRNHGFVKEAWEELKLSTKNLGKAVLVATAQNTSQVINRLAKIINPPPTVLKISFNQAERLVKTHLPTDYLKAHTTAIIKGIFAPGNPHDKAGVAEKVYAQLRKHESLPRNTVLLLDKKILESPKLLQQLTQIAKRDKAVVIMTDLKQQNRQRTYSRSMHRD